MLILKPGNQEGLHFPNPANPENFVSIGKVPTHPKAAPIVDIRKMKILKDRPSLEVKTEDESVMIHIGGDAIIIEELEVKIEDKITTDTLGDDLAIEEEKNETKTGELLSCGTTAILFPNRTYFFKKSEGVTFLTFSWLYRS